KLPLAALAFAAFLFLLLPPAAGAAALESGPTARGSVEQVYVIGAQPGSAATLLDAAGRVVQVGKIDEFGALLFRGVTPGEGYTVELAAAGGFTRLGPIRVLSRDARP